MDALDVTVRFAPSGRSVRIPPGTPLLEAIRRAGLPLARACGAEGLCARCGVRVLEGGASLPAESAGEAEAKRRNRVAPDLRLACRVVAEADLEVRAPGW